VPEAPPAAAYQELGDLKFPELLAEESAPPEPEKETVIRGGNFSSDDTKVVVKGTAQEPEEETVYRIKGGDGSQGKKKGLLRRVLGGGKNEDGEDAGVTVVSGKKDEDAENVSSRLMSELQSGPLNKALSKAQEEISDLKKDLQGFKAQKMAEGLMSQVVAEKSRLAELARSVNQSIRQKEIEFRTKETALREDLRRRDEILRQKETALLRMKEQVNQLRAQLDQAKSSKAEADEENVGRQKHQFLQKLYDTAKEENTRMSSELLQLKTEVVNFKYLAKKADEYKKQYLALAEKKTETKKETPTQSAAAVTALKRAEAEAKAAAMYKREAAELRTRMSQLQLKYEESQREESRLKMELGRAQEELKSLKAANAKEKASLKPAPTKPGAPKAA
jgi:hypothetical protein